MIQAQFSQSPGDGIPIQLAEWPGRGRTVLGIHGLTANCLCWDALAPGIAPEHRLLAMDLRGRGLSGKPSTGYSIEKHCRDISNVLTSRDQEQITLMGHSLGAYIALFFAAAHPEWVQGLILVDGGAILSPEQWTRISAGIKPSLDRLGQIFPSFRAYCEQIKKAPFFQPWNERLEKYFEYESERVPGGVRSRQQPETVAEERANLLQTDFASCYPAVRCPVLVLRATKGMLSKDDLVLPEACLPDLMQALPQSRLVHLEDTHHFSILFQDNAQRDQAIHDFLQ